MDIVRFGDVVPSVEPDPELLGGKGAGLVRMSRIEQEYLRIPPGVVVPTSACHRYYEDEDGRHEFVKSLVGEVVSAMFPCESGGFDGKLVSVRSGAPVSMPGMMDTVLNVGVTSETYRDVEEDVGDATAVRCLRNLVWSLATSAWGVSETTLTNMWDVLLHDELLDDLDRVQRLVDTLEKYTGREWPDTVEEQLYEAITAVFRSWSSERAVAYRRADCLSDDMYTAVVVQQMVFGNRGPDSGTGVLFTRDPRTGDRGIYGEFLPDAQGEDLVSGRVTPHDLRLAENGDFGPVWKRVYDELTTVSAVLEDEYRDMVDVEFTVEEGVLYVLQARPGKRTGKAAFRIFSDMVDGGMVGGDDLVRMVRPEHYKTATRPRVREGYDVEPTGKGIAVTPGVGSGRAAYSRDEDTEDKVLVVHDTSPEDVEAIRKAAAVVTRNGGSTSHAAVVTRAMGVPCVVGCNDLSFNEAGAVYLNGVPLTADTILTVCGESGSVWVDEDVPVEDGDPPGLDTALQLTARRVVGAGFDEPVSGCPYWVKMELLYGLGTTPDEVVEMVVGAMVECGPSVLVVDCSRERYVLPGEMTYLVEPYTESSFQDWCEDVLSRMMQHDLSGYQHRLVAHTTSQYAGFKNLREAKNLREVLSGVPFMVRDDVADELFGGREIMDVVLSKAEEQSLSVCPVGELFVPGQLLLGYLEAGETEWH